MISRMARALISVGPNPAIGFGPGAKAGVAEGQEGGPGSGRRPEGESTPGQDSHRGARIYQSGKAFRALTPTGHNIGPFKTQDLLKAHLDKMDSSFGLSQKQAVSATSSAPQLRPTQKKESQATSEAKLFNFRESNTDSFKNHKFEVVVIKEGLGNFRDRFFYTKQALQQAKEAKLFEGAQCFADHPSEIEEQSRPERSTRDILGYYENVRYLENKEGQGTLVADLVVSDTISLDWATALLTNSIEYSKKFKEADLVGLSINASGAAEPTGIDEFMSSQSLPAVVVSKLNEAKAQGVEEINVVNELKEAQSVDLVTKAGAGGRILQMLEQEKRMGKQLNPYLKLKENEDGKPSANDGATPDHADAEQDKALFAQMIKQYLGKDDASPEEMEMAKHTHEACKEMGMEGKEAYEAAGSHLKMAMAVGKKMSQKQTEKKEGESQEGETEQESQESETEAEASEGECGNKEGQTPPPNPNSTDGKKQESMKEMIALSGEVAKLRESLKRYELRDYLEKKLSESGKSNSVTKKFREALGIPRSKEQIDATWKIFIQAYEAGAEEVSSDFSEGFLSEKQTYRESGSGNQVKSGFGDCLR